MRPPKSTLSIPVAADRAAPCPRQRPAAPRATSSESRRRRRSARADTSRMRQARIGSCPGPGRLGHPCSPRRAADLQLDRPRRNGRGHRPRRDLRSCPSSTGRRTGSGEATGLPVDSARQRQRLDRLRAGGGRALRRSAASSGVSTRRRSDDAVPRAPIRQLADLERGELLLLRQTGLAGPLRAPAEARPTGRSRRGDPRREDRSPPASSAIPRQRPPLAMKATDLPRPALPRPRGQGRVRRDRPAPLRPRRRRPAQLKSRRCAASPSRNRRPPASAST